MYLELSTSHAADLLVADENAAWTYAGAKRLIEWLEEAEYATGEKTALDVVALRCYFSEYRESDEWLVTDYGRDGETWEEVAVRLEEETTVLRFTDLVTGESGVIVGAY